MHSTITWVLNVPFEGVSSGLWVKVVVDILL